MPAGAAVLWSARRIAVGRSRCRMAHTLLALGAVCWVLFVGIAFLLGRVRRANST
jgi:hypothetical protein